MTRSDLDKYPVEGFPGLDPASLPKSVGFYKGKVRDILDLGDTLVIAASDRLSAFDKIVTTIPFKGELLNRIATFWFDRTKDVVANHILKPLTPRSVLVRKAKMLPVEVVIRGYLTGSAWRDYQAGKAISGIRLPAGLRFNQRFDTPLLTPTTKETDKHDMPISGPELVARGLVEEGLWRKVEKAAIAVFERGREIAAKNGLILVDTKYEFGTINGELVLADEIHTPDSSRYWFADSFEELFARGEKQRELDKEYLRRWLMEHGFAGEGAIPVVPDDIRREVAWRYIQAFEIITGDKFALHQPDFDAERKNILSML